MLRHPVSPSCTATGASLGGFAVYGRARARLGQSVEVKGGDVGVKEARAPQTGPDFDLLLEPHARVDVAKRVFGGLVLLKTGARVGQVFTNRLDNRGGTHGAVSPFPTMPDLVAIPEVAGGTRAITVASGRTVTLDPASDLGRVLVKHRGVLRLRGGLYELRSLELASQAKIEALGAVEIRARDGLSIGSQGSVGPAAYYGSALTARDVRLLVAGTGAPSVIVGERASLRGLLVAPGRAVDVRPYATLRGALVSNEVSLQSGASVIFEDGVSGAGPALSCDDGNSCNGIETCDSRGICVPGTPPVIDDGRPCTIDSCDPATGVVHRPASDGTACSDGNGCTQADSCEAGVCIGRDPVICTVLDKCHEAGICDPATGRCSNPETPDGTACGDGDACTGMGTCQAGACASEPVVCVAVDACHDPGVCDPNATGTCSNPPRPCADNRSPTIVSEPVTSFVVTTGQGPIEPVDLRPWTVVNYDFLDQPDGRWVIDPSGTVASQTVNADATILLSDITLVADRIEGTWRVNTGSDDDLMGFVFGHQDSSHFYLFDWKQTDQNNRYGRAEAGMSVKVIDAASTLGALDLWPTAGNGARVRNLFQNRIPWQDFVTYRFVLEVRPGHFTITVSEGDLTLATISIDDATYRSGRFGFYNYSQSAVEYSGFVRQRIASPTYRYDVDAVDPDNDDLTYSLETAPSGMNVDRATGLITRDVEVRTQAATTSRSRPPIPTVSSTSSGSRSWSNATSRRWLMQGRSKRPWA